MLGSQKLLCHIQYKRATPPSTHLFAWIPLYGFLCTVFCSLCYHRPLSITISNLSIYLCHTISGCKCNTMYLITSLLLAFQAIAPPFQMLLSAHLYVPPNQNQNAYFLRLGYLQWYRAIFFSFLFFFLSENCVLYGVINEQTLDMIISRKREEALKTL